VNLPLYRPVAGNGVWDNIKKAVMTIGFAMTATERNPDFQEDIFQVGRRPCGSGARC
jgi:hypothetical protein